MSEHGTKLLTKPELFTSARLKAELEAFGINTSARDKTSLVKLYRTNSTKIARMLKDTSSRGRSSSRGSTPARKTNKAAAGQVPAFVKNLSHRELHEALTKILGSCGPVTAASRGLLEKRYVRLLAESDEEPEEEEEEEEAEEEEEEVEEEQVQTRVVTSRVVTSKPVRTVQTFRGRTKQVDRSTRTKPTGGMFSDEEEETKPAGNAEVDEDEGDMMTVGFFCRLVLILIFMVVIIAVFTEAGQEQLQTYIAQFKGSPLASKTLPSSDN